MQPSPISHTAFFGDGQRTFLLRTPYLIELQNKTGVGVGALFERLRHRAFGLADIRETIRLALIGGGCDPEEAASLIATYVDNQPLSANFELAVDILTALWFGNREVADE